MQHWSYEKKPSNAGRNSQQKVFQDMQSPVRQSLPGSGTGLGRESFGKARSQPLKIKPKFRASYSVPDTSADERRASQLRSEKSGEKRGSKRRSSVPEKPLLLRTSYARPSITQLTRKRSRSATDLNKDKDNQGKALRWSRNLGLGATSEELEEAFVTRHMLYKEAMYTGVHFLGRPTDRFPVDKESICIYVHEAFSTSSKEQQAVVDHVKGELFPMIGVNTKILKAEGLQSSTPGKNHPNPYCVVAIETEGSIGKKEWQQSPISSENRLSRFLRRSEMLQPPAQRRVQLYSMIPQAHKTIVKPHDKNPVWGQAFQCVSIHPSTDMLAVEVWDRVDDDSLRKSIDAYNAAHRIGEGGNPIITHKLSRGDVNKSDVFLGKVSKRVNEIPCDGFEKTSHLGGLSQSQDLLTHGKLRVRLWLVHLYRHGKPYVDVVDKRTMLVCLWDWILSFEKKRNGSAWDGKLPQEASCLLYQYALQTGISEETHSYIRWEAYSKHKLDIDGLDAPLKDLGGVLQKRKSSDDKLGIDDSQLSVENSILILMDESIFPIIRNHLKETEGQVSKALKAYKNCEDVLSKYEPSFALPVIRGLLEKALRLCFLEWYQATYALRVQSVRSVDECQRVKLYVDVITDVNKLLTIGMKRWHPEFWMLAQYESYTPIMYDELQKMVNHDIEMICWSLLRHYNDNKRLRKMLTDRNRKENECTISALFSLYAGTQTFVEAQHQIFTGVEESPQYDNLANYHKWFRPILVLWLGFAVIRGSEIITRCVNIDTVSMDNIHAQTSTSALDTAAVIHQLVQFWERLMWPDVCENYVIIHFLIEVMCYFTVLYAERKLEKLELEGYFDTIDQFDISERLCIALNNIEYVKEALEGIPEEIKYDALIRELEDKCGITRETYNYRIRLKQVFTFTYVNVDLIFNSILEGVGKRVRPEIKRCVRDCLEIVQANLSRSGRESSRDALDPIFNYIDSNIITLAKSLLTLNFARMLQLFWDIILRELLYAGSNVEVKGGEQQKTVFDRLLTMLPMLRTYFHNNDGGLSEDELNTPVYWEVHDVMNMYTLETPAIISHFYRVRGDSQVSDPKTAPYGILTVRASYWNGKLTVEVIAAYNLVAMDDAFQLWNLCMKSQPSNDPYVEVEIQPERKFSNIRTSRTKVQRKTVNPTFNEKFHWDVSQEESGQEDAVILFTVKDYDFLSHNDFLGEAVVPFSKIPGIAAKPIPQPMHLNLRVVEPSHTLHIFKSRHWDPESQRFYERHAKRGSVE